MIHDYKAVIFDWDGTIVDTCGLILDAHNHVRRYFELAEWTMEDFLGRASESAREYYPKVYGDKADKAQEVLYDYVEEHHLNYLEPMQNVAAFLDYLKLNNMPMAVVSNKRHKTLLKEIEHVEYGHYFDFVIGAGVAEKDKPAPDPLFNAIGDTETDLLTAQNAKCPAVFIQSDCLRPDLVEKYKPNYHYESISSFFDEFKSLSELKTAVGS